MVPSVFAKKGPQKEVDIIKNGGKRSGNENGDFSRDVLFCRRQHENRCSGTSEIGPESGKKRSRDVVGDRGAFRELFCMILEQKWR